MTPEKEIAVTKTKLTLESVNQRKRNLEALIVDPEEIGVILIRLSEGENLPEIASDYQVSYLALSKFMRGHELINDRFQEAINAGSEIRINAVIDAIQKIALADPKDAFDEEGKVLHIKDMPENLRKAIASFEFSEKETKIKFWNKLDALKLRGQVKDLKMFAEDGKGSGASININIQSLAPEIVIENSANNT